MVLPSRFRGVASFIRRSLLRGVVLSALAFGTARATEPISLGSATSRRDDTVTLVERVKNSVVNIHSERTVTQAADDPFRPGLMQPPRVNGMGTGIVLDPRGYIVTNYHVIDDVLRDPAGQKPRFTAMWAGIAAAFAGAPASAGRG